MVPAKPTYKVTGRDVARLLVMLRLTGFTLAADRYATLSRRRKRELYSHYREQLIHFNRPKGPPL